MANPKKISTRKAEHLDICLSNEVGFREKTTGFERLHLVHNALPELNFEEINTSTTFLGKSLELPLMISGITGGFRGAEAINAQLATVCEARKVALGLGSQRQMLEDSRHVRSFSIVREKAPSIPIVGNIGAAQVAKSLPLDALRRLIDAVGADALAIHLNPLQEVIQPEGDRDYRGVLQGIERLVKSLEVPVIVKETGAGISREVAQRLFEVGVRYIDVAGAGGTSWAGVESYRTPNRHLAEKFWDWGIPTAYSILEIRQIPDLHIIASGGIQGGIDMAKALALGAELTGAARPLLKALMEQGEEGLVRLLDEWHLELRTAMFLTGSPNLQALRKVRVVNDQWRDLRDELRGKTSAD